MIVQSVATPQSAIDHRSQHSMRFSGQHLSLCCVVGCFLLVALIVHPFGNFPVDDDAGYGMSVFEFVRTGHFQFPTWAGMPMIPQLLLGTIACLIFSPSFNTLHGLALCIGVAGIFTVYRLARELDLSQNESAVAAASLAFNPIYFALSFRFISDQLHFIFLLLATICFVRATKSGFVESKFGMPIFSTLAVLSRQCAISLPLANLAVNSVRHRFDIRKLGASLASLLLPLLCLFAFDYWKTHCGQHSLNYRTVIELAAHSHTASLPQQISRLLRLPLYTGFYLLPLSLSLYAGYWNDRRKSVAIIAAVALLYAVVTSVGLHPMPSCGAIFEANGLGPKVLPISMPELPVWLRYLLSWVCSISFLTLLNESVYAARKQGLLKIAGHPTLLYAIAFCLAYTVPIVRLPAFFDKYTLPLALPGLLLLLANYRARRIRLEVGLACTMLTASLTLFCAFNYYAYSSACWDLTRSAIKEGIAPDHVSDGFECVLLFTQQPHDAYVNNWYEWTPRRDAELICAPVQRPGFKIVRGISFHCLPDSHPQFWLYEREDLQRRSSDAGIADLVKYGVAREQPLSAGSHWLSVPNPQ
ncbi:MAG TPA: glycosyltransferase family 39 protein [Planktothrix sp.]|jgi:hypothetical protein